MLCATLTVRPARNVQSRPMTKREERNNETYDSERRDRQTVDGLLPNQKSASRQERRWTSLLQLLERQARFYIQEFGTHLHVKIRFRYCRWVTLTRGNQQKIPNDQKGKKTTACCTENLVLLVAARRNPLPGKQAEETGPKVVEPFSQGTINDDDAALIKENSSADTDIRRDPLARATPPSVAIDAGEGSRETLSLKSKRKA